LINPATTKINRKLAARKFAPAYSLPGVLIAPRRRFESSSGAQAAIPFRPQRGMIRRGSPQARHVQAFRFQEKTGWLSSTG
jgi:hypothetical protein